MQIINVQIVRNASESQHLAIRYAGGIEDCLTHNIGARP